MRGNSLIIDFLNESSLIYYQFEGSPRNHIHTTPFAITPLVSYITLPVLLQQLYSIGLWWTGICIANN
jgi:hypothetical protein